MDEFEAEAEAVLEAAVAHLRETSYMYTNVYFDDRTQALAKQTLAQQGFTTRDEVVQFYEASPPALHDLVKATCTQHVDKIIADLGSLTGTGRYLVRPSVLAAAARAVNGLRRLAAARLPPGCAACTATPADLCIL